MQEIHAKREDLLDPLFELGRLQATPGALEEFEKRDVDPKRVIELHARGDWGEVPGETWIANERNLLANGELFSVHRVAEDSTVWVLTDWERTATTVMMPNELPQSELIDLISRGGLKREAGLEAVRGPSWTQGVVVSEEAANALRYKLSDEDRRALKEVVDSSEGHGEQEKAQPRAPWSLSALKAVRRVLGLEGKGSSRP